MESSVHKTEELVFFVLLQLIAILGAARAGGQLARWLKQPQVVGEIFAGLLLGPSLFGKLFPGFFTTVFQSVSAEPLTVLSQIGLVLLMFQIGLDFDFSHLREARNRRAVILVSIAGIAVPFGLGLVLAQCSHGFLAAEKSWLGYLLFMATALSITAIPILGRIMMELELTTTRLGAIAISAAAVNDIAGWLLLAAISALAAASFSPGDTLVKIVLLLGYFSLCWWAVKPLLRWLIRRFEVSASRLPQNFLSILLAIIFLSALATYELGIFAIFGGFAMGVLVYDQEEFVKAWKQRIAPFVTIFFLPIFFTYTGLRTDIYGLDSPAMWGWCAAVIAAATLGKFGGCYAAARWSGLSRLEAGCIGVMMNTRALMELVVVNVGLDLGVIPPPVFTMLVLMAILSTVMTAPILRLWLPRMGHAIPAAPPEV
ncbi:MAG: cation:proton antiporter [Planctomycetes bacterium]|nr:cation:proton antiporter [Planctomycetota bacterium]